MIANQSLFAILESELRTWALAKISEVGAIPHRVDQA
jgi:hypothetical protein